MSDGVGECGRRERADIGFIHGGTDDLSTLKAITTVPKNADEYMDADGKIEP